MARTFSVKRKHITVNSQWFPIFAWILRQMTKISFLWKGNMKTSSWLMTSKSVNGSNQWIFYAILRNSELSINCNTYAIRQFFLNILMSMLWLQQLRSSRSRTLNLEPNEVECHAPSKRIFFSWGLSLSNPAHSDGQRSGEDRIPTDFPINFPWAITGRSRNMATIRGGFRQIFQELLLVDLGT